MKLLRGVGHRISEAEVGGSGGNFSYFNGQRCIYSMHICIE